MNLIRFSGRSFLPMKYMCKMIATNQVTPVPTSPQHTFQTRILNIAGVFNDSANVNGFDIMNSLYERWRVNYASISLQVINLGVVSVSFAMLAEPTLATFTNTLEMMEQPFSKRRVINSGIGGNAFQTIKYPIAPKKLFGRNLKYDDDGVSNGVNNTGPTGTNAMWNVILETLDGTDSVEVTYYTKVTYWVTWYDRKIVPQTT